MGAHLDFFQLAWAGPGVPGGRDPLPAHKRMIPGPGAHRGGFLDQLEKIQVGAHAWGGQHLSIWDPIFD